MPGVKVKVRFSEATHDILERVGAEEEISRPDVAMKALQTIGIVQAYIQEGKVFSALDGGSREFLRIIEIPPIPCKGEGDRGYCWHVSEEIHRELTRIADEMGCPSVDDVFCRGVLLYEKIREHRSKGMRFGATYKYHPHTLYAEFFMPGITVL